MAEQMSIDQIRVDQNSLYKEETITDLRVASIRRLIPIKSDGTTDSSRETMFIASTQIMSQMGPLPISAQIEAKTLQEALDKFPQTIKQAIEDMVEEAKEYRRQEASRIVVPGAMPGGMPGGGMPGAGRPGAGGRGGIIPG